MEVVPKVHFIPNPVTGPAGTHGCNVFVVGSGLEAALIDAGLAREEAVKAKLDYLEEMGLSRVAHIIVSHAHGDHLGGAPAIQNAVGGTIALHRADVEAANEAISPATVGRTLEDGETIEVDGLHLEVIHTPGHSPGHICLYLRERRMLFTGDHVVGRGTTAIMPPKGDMALYIDSLRRLFDYEAELLCPGHGPVVRVPQLKIQELIDHRLDRERQVLDGLRRGQRQIETLLQEIYPELSPRLLPLARGQILAHLIKLEREDRVRAEVSGEETSYRLL